MSGMGIHSSGDAVLFFSVVVVVLAVALIWGWWSSRFGQGKYRGVRLINWTRAQREQERERKRHLGENER
jgi:hypothetical protein